MANEKRLIDANAIKYREKIECCGHGDYRPMHFVTPEDIAKLPTVDAVEVVHGRWENAEYCGFVRCDQCKDVYIDESWLDDGRWKYCPNCGARMMDGGDEDV